MGLSAIRLQGEITPVRRAILSVKYYVLYQLCELHARKLPVRLSAFAAAQKPTSVCLDTNKSDTTLY